MFGMTTGASHLLRGDLRQADGVIRVVVEQVEVSDSSAGWSGEFAGQEENLMLGYETTVEA